MSEALLSTFRVGTAGLLVALGCPDALLDETWRHLVAQPIPSSHQEIVKQVRQAIAHVQARYGESEAR